MSDKLVLPEAMTDDEALRFTQRMRKGYIDHLTEGSFPTDPKEQALLLTAMSDMDRSAIQNKRIGNDASQAEADRLAALMIAKMSNHFAGTDPFAVSDGKEVREFPDVDMTNLPEPTLVPGETEIGISDLNYEEFAGRMAKVNQS